MCIAIAKLKGENLPSDKILRNCFENNPDGGGFAFNLDNKVVIQKGYMDFDSFINAIHKADKKYHLKDRGVLIHTRITTHGGTNREMTHPFPICADDGIMKKTYYQSQYAVIHNGIISLTSTEATSRKTMSDTAVFIEKYLSKIATNRGWFKNPSNIEMIEDLIDSKMAILNVNGDIIMTSGFTLDNGVYYSNTSYQDSYTRWSKYYNYNYVYSGYDYDDDECVQGKNNVKTYYESLAKEGYSYDKEKGYWCKSNKKKEEEKSTKMLGEPLNKSKGNIVSLMRLKKGETLMLSDFTTEDYIDEIAYFITNEGEVYYTLTENNENNLKKLYITDNLCSLGEGEFLDKNFNPIIFRAEQYIFRSQLDNYFSYYQNENEEEDEEDYPSQN